MHVTRILNALKRNGFSLKSRTPLPNGHGEKFVLSNSAFLTFYPTTGNWLIQGKPSPQDQAKLEALMQKLYPKPLAEDFGTQAAPNPLTHRRIQSAIGTRNEKDVLLNRERDEGWSQEQQQGRSTDQPQKKTMRFDIDAICRRIIEVGIHKANLPEAVAQQVAFHLTDGLRDLEEFYDFCSAPMRLSDEKVHRLLVAFLCSVPNHVAAAAKLYADLPVADVFDVGAVEGPEDTL